MKKQLSLIKQSYLKAKKFYEHNVCRVFFIDRVCLIGLNTEDELFLLF